MDLEARDQITPCTFCAGRDHVRLACPKRWTRDGEQASVTCSFCGSRLHLREACPKSPSTAEVIS